MKRQKDKKDVQIEKKLDLKIIIFNIVEKLLGLNVVHKLYHRVTTRNILKILKKSSN